MYHCVTVSLCQCLTVSMSHCVTVSLQCSALSHYITFRQIILIIFLLSRIKISRLEFGKQIFYYKMRIFVKKSMDKHSLILPDIHMFHQNLNKKKLDNNKTFFWSITTLCSMSFSLRKVLNSTSLLSSKSIKFRRLSSQIDCIAPFCGHVEGETLSK